MKQIFGFSYPTFQISIIFNDAYPLLLIINTYYSIYNQYYITITWDLFTTLAGNGIYQGWRTYDTRARGCTFVKFMCYKFVYTN